MIAMMRWALAAVVAVCAPSRLATADGSSAQPTSSFTMPPGYEEVHTPIEGLLVMARTDPGIIKADARIYESPEGGRLVEMESLSQHEGAVAWSDLEHAAKRLLGRISKAKASKVSSSSFKHEGPLLVADATGAVNNRPFRMHGLYAADSHHVIHALMIMCGATEELQDGCVGAHESMHILVADQVVPETTSSSDRAREDAIMDLMMGAIVLLGLGMIVMRKTGRGPQWLRR